MFTLALLAVGTGVGPLGAPDDFHVIHRAQPGQNIRFVRIEQSPGPLRLGIYSDSERLGVWPKDPVRGLPPMSLDLNQHFIAERREDALGLATVHYPCLDLPDGLPVADFTSLEFPDGYPNFDPSLPRTQPIPPPPVPGACSIHLSRDARLAIFVGHGLEIDQPRPVRVFHRPLPSSAGFEATGSYVNQGMGEIESSLDGLRFAHREGATVRVFHGANANAPTAILPTSGAFELSANGEWLARSTSRGVSIDRFLDNGEIAVDTRTLDREESILELVWVGDLLAVRGPAEILLFDPESGESVLRLSRTQGEFRSVDVLEVQPSRRLVATSELVLIQPPMRRGGKHIEGQALAVIEVVEFPGGVPRARTEIPLKRWDRGMPSVRFLSSPTRVLVAMPEVALLSEEITLP
jgi:hypothetical protein